MLAQDKFKAASLQAKAAYEVWFKCVGRNNMQCLARWHVNGEHGMTCV